MTFATVAVNIPNRDDVGDAIAAEGIEYLRGVNAARRVIGQNMTVA
jgi:hypothetical protein